MRRGAARKPLALVAVAPRHLRNTIVMISHRYAEAGRCRCAADVQSARRALRSYFKGGTISMTPEPHGDGEAYVARGEFMPLALLTDKAATPSEPEPGGRCPPWVVRACNSSSWLEASGCAGAILNVWTTALTVPIEVRVA